MEVNQCLLSPSFNSQPRSLSFPKRPVGGQVFTEPTASRGRPPIGPNKALKTHLWACRLK
jgi:hypothetical protein